MIEDERCIRCGLPRSHQRHDRKNPPKEGWHVFLGQDYLNGLEDALLFAHEHNQKHQWVESGITIDTYPPFSEKHCKICGAINWGGKEDTICFGNSYAPQALVAASNRRSVKNSMKRLEDEKNKEKS